MRSIECPAPAECRGLREELDLDLVVAVVDTAMVGLEVLGIPDVTGWDEV